MEFAYIAADTTGIRQKGIIEANTEKEVVDFLRQNKLVPLSIKTTQKMTASLFGGKVKNSDIVIFTRQLSSMITTGLTLIQALDILKNQTTKPEMRNLLNDLTSTISEGSSFSQALEGHKDVFSEVYISLIKAAEQGGLLDKVLARLADNMEKSEDLHKHVKSALFYPMIVITGVVGVIMVMNIFVIPQLGKLYESLNLALPLPTQIVLGTSKFLTTFFPLIIVGIIGAAIGYKRFTKTPQGKHIVDSVKLKLPVFGEIIRLSVLDEITRTLSLLISSGTSILEAISVSANVAGNTIYQDAMQETGTLVEKGVSLSDALQNQKIFPSILVQMVRVGESTGKIDDSLLRIAEYFERDLNLKVKNLTTAIEPILIVVLGATVGFLILSVITPIYSLISQIQ